MGKKRKAPVQDFKKGQRVRINHSMGYGIQYGRVRKVSPALITVKMEKGLVEDVVRSRICKARIVEEV